MNSISEKLSEIKALGEREPRKLSTIYYLCGSIPSLVSALEIAIASLERIDQELIERSEMEDIAFAALAQIRTALLGKDEK